MDENGRHPRILFVMQTALGWSTNTAHMKRLVDQRSDIETRWINVPHLGWQRHLMKRTVKSGWRDIFRQNSPLDVYAGSAGRALRLAASEFKPDLIHCAGHWPGAAFTANTPLSLAFDATMLGINDALRPDHWTDTEIAKECALLRRSALLWPMSGWASKFLPSDINARSTILPPSALIPDQHTGSRALNPVPQILFVGNDFERKGGARLVAMIKGPLAGRAHLHIVSADAPLTEHPDITVHGRVRHDRLINDLMPRQDILCLPTRSDMSPLVLAEGAAAGLALIASDLAGLSELITPQKTGYRVDRDDDAHFLKALDMLIIDRERLARMQRNARADAEARFDADKNFSTLLDQLARRAAQHRDLAS